MFAYKKGKFIAYAGNVMRMNQTLFPAPAIKTPYGNIYYSGERNAPVLPKLISLPKNGREALGKALTGNDDGYVIGYLVDSQKRLFTFVVGAERFLNGVFDLSTSEFVVQHHDRDHEDSILEACRIADTVEEALMLYFKVLRHSPENYQVLDLQAVVDEMIAEGRTDDVLDHLYAAELEGGE